MPTSHSKTTTYSLNPIVQSRKKCRRCLEQFTCTSTDPRTYLWLVSELTLVGTRTHNERLGFLEIHCSRVIGPIRGSSRAYTHPNQNCSLFPTLRASEDINLVKKILFVYNMYYFDHWSDSELSLQIGLMTWCRLHTIILLNFKVSGSKSLNFYKFLWSVQMGLIWLQLGPPPEIRP